MKNHEPLTVSPNAEKVRSIKSEIDLLRCAINSPESLSSELFGLLQSALPSQKGLAQLEYKDLNIVGMSLNTHKTISAQTLDGGYQTLDAYRKAALNSLLEFKTREHKPNRGTIGWYKEALSDSEKARSDLHNEIARISQALIEFISFAHQVANESDKLDRFGIELTRLLRKYNFKVNEQ